jgi:hypothetical protein
MELVVSTAVSQLSNLTFATNLTHNLLSQTIHKSFSVIRKFVSTEHEQINDVLVENDLISTLEIIQALMDDIEGVNKEQNNYDICSGKKSIQKALTNLHFIVEEISKSLEKIDFKIKNHQGKYFHRWRTLNYESELNKLKKNIKLLNIRYQMLLEVIKVSR